MCGPAVPLVFTAIQTGLQIASTIQQANAQRAQGEAQNAYYQHQARIQEQNALLAERSGAAQSKAIQDVQRLEGRNLKYDQARFRASQRAALAASGITLDSGTAGDIIRDTTFSQAMDESLLRYGSDVKSYEALTGAQNQAYGYRSEAAGNRAAGLNARYAGQIASRSTLMGGAASVLSPFVFKPFANFAIPGVGGYGAGTPYGVRSANTGLFGLGTPYSRLPGR